MISSLDELRAFTAVYESKGFTAAGRRLGVSTNAVSLRIQKLEESLATRLFVRTTRSVAPTEEGRNFYARVSRILAELEQAEDELHPRTLGLHGSVRLAIPSALAADPLFERLRELLDAHPRLSVQTRVTSRPIDLVSEGIDVGVVVGQPPDSTFVGRLLGRVTWVLAAAPSYLERHGTPRAPEELSHHRCLRFLSSPPQTEWTLVNRRGREVVIPVDGGYEADDSRSLADATYRGLGIGIRPKGECERAQSEGRLQQVLPNYRFVPLDVYALVPNGRIRVPRVAACLEILREVVVELA